MNSIPSATSPLGHRARITLGILSLITVQLLQAGALGFLGRDGAGTSSFALLRIGQGPRATALGEAYVSMADDASAIYWNPAGLGLQPAGRYAASHQWWFQDITDEVLHAAIPAGPGALGFGLVYSGDPGIQSWDENNMPGDTFRTWSGVATAGYGLPIAPGYWLGGAVKGLYENLRDVNGVGGALDLGFVARFPGPGIGRRTSTFAVPYRPGQTGSRIMVQKPPFVVPLSVGIVGRNLGAVFYNGDAEMLPVEVAAGASATAGRFTATADVVIPRESDVNVRAGLEFTPVNDLAIRLGYRTGPADLRTLGFASGLTAGLGVTVGNFSVDYSFVPYGKLGLAHRIGLQAQFSRKGSSTLGLRVVDARTNEGVAAGLAFSGIHRGAAGTDLFGQYHLRDLPDGLLVVKAAREGYLPQVETVDIRRQFHEKQVLIVLQSMDDGCVWGAVTDAETGKPLGGTITWQGPTGGTLAVDDVLGSFALKALTTGTYVFTASGPTPDYFTQTCTLEVVAGRLAQHDFSLARPPRAMVFGGVFFDPGKAAIRAEFEPVIQGVAQAMAEDQGLTLEIAGHADGYETPMPGFASLYVLSLARAEAVLRRLTETHGVSPSRLTARGYAETRAMGSSDTPEGQVKNRSVEFVVIRQ